MKIAFVGKGGSGKTTLAAITARYLAARKLPVMAIDADINQHLGESLGLTEEESVNMPAMGLEINRIKSYLKGTNTRIKDKTDMIKTTPPGSGSRLLTVTEDNPIYKHFVKEVGGVRLMAVGPFTAEDLGVKCYHSKTGSVELLLNHLIDRENEYVIVDMTAGADSFASGLFTRFDVTFLVVEPTKKSTSVYQQYKKYADQHNVHIRVIGNKIENADDISYIKEQVGDNIIASFSHSQFVRTMEKESLLSISELETENQQELESLIAEAGQQKKDWGAFYQQAIFFHKKNAESWANAAVGIDVTQQIDPDFLLEDVVTTM